MSNLEKSVPVLIPEETSSFLKKFCEITGKNEDKVVNDAIIRMLSPFLENGKLNPRNGVFHKGLSEDGSSEKVVHGEPVDVTDIPCLILSHNVL